MSAKSSPFFRSFCLGIIVIIIASVLHKKITFIERFSSMTFMLVTFVLGFPKRCLRRKTSAFSIQQLINSTIFVIYTIIILLLAEDMIGVAKNAYFFGFILTFAMVLYMHVELFIIHLYRSRKLKSVIARKEYEYEAESCDDSDPTTSQPPEENIYEEIIYIDAINKTATYTNAGSSGIHENQNDQHTLNVLELNNLDEASSQETIGNQEAVGYF